ncbi:CRE-EGL-23 protein [Caenorhabditis remanei]|uniref:CRE-EGL-23 protein n=1 Tax=Caenorhabditis remanei TaxID=31234 RepID=E3NBQ2_CAERE|nr:CRE-EGL-23 protein [Caenorhabditis remanei]
MKLTLKKSVFRGEKHLLQKATPLFVHFLMIVSVGAYAIFGALVMRSLESKTITTIEKKTDVHRRHLNLSSSVEIQNVPPIPSELRHRRRRRHNDTLDQFSENFRMSREKRAAAHIMRSRKCVISVIKKMSRLECSMDTLDEKLVKALDECYHVAVEHNTHVNHVLYENSKEEVESVGEESEEEIAEWSFMDSLLFAFTVITTIGYGNVAPRTFGGRLFVIGYGLIGIPFTLLAIADLGKFISEMMVVAKTFCKKTWKKLKKAWNPNFIRYPKLSGAKDLSNTDIEEKILENEKIENEIESSETSEEEDDLTETEATSLFILFLLYIAFGGMMLAAYEPDMDFFKAVYFNFVTLTSIGLGDIVPRSETYMLITIVYIAIGLALTTIAIEIAADALKKLHYFGRKIENVGNVAIWFGGKKITMKALVKNLGDQFNLPTTVVKSLNLDHFVDQAIKVEEGEIETLRPPPFEPDSERFDAEFADEPESEWIRDPTPTPPPSPQPVYRLPSPKPKTPSPLPSPSITDKSMAIATPSPEESEDDEELILPSPEPSPIREPTPSPPPREPTPREPTPEPEPYREPTPPPPPPPKPRPLTAAEIAAQKRKAYSEEAWRRYQEYQKQWKKFRQTQKTPAPGASTSGASTSKQSGASPEGGGQAGTGPSTRSQSVTSVASGKTSRSATPESKKSSHPSSSSRRESGAK